MSRKGLIFDRLSTVWANLEPEQRIEWHFQASLLPRINESDQLITSNGWQYFVDVNTQLAVAGAAAAAGAGAAAAGAAAGAASAVGAGAAATAPSSMIATTWLEVTVEPSANLISFSTPSTGDGTSRTTLSVSRSSRFSSRLTASPTFLCQVAMVPSATDSGSTGALTSVAIAGASWFVF